MFPPGSTKDVLAAIFDVVCKDYDSVKAVKALVDEGMHSTYANYISHH